MTYKIIVFGCLLSFSYVLRGQSFQANVSLGGAMSQIDGDESAGFHRIGPTGGVGVGLNLKDNLDLSWGLNYGHRGSKRDPKALIDWSYRINYIELPVCADWTAWQKIHLILGPSVGYAVKRSFYQGNYQFDITDEIKPLNFDLVAGVAYELSDRLKVEARHLRSLVTVKVGPPRMYFIHRTLYVQLVYSLK